MSNQQNPPNPPKYDWKVAFEDGTRTSVLSSNLEDVCRILHAATEKKVVELSRSPRPLDPLDIMAMNFG